MHEKQTAHVNIQAREKLVKFKKEGCIYFCCAIIYLMLVALQLYAFTHILSLSCISGDVFFKKKILLLSFDDAIPLTSINTLDFTFILRISFSKGKNVLHSVRLREIHFRLLRQMIQLAEVLH